MAEQGSVRNPSYLPPATAKHRNVRAAPGVFVWSHPRQEISMAKSNRAADVASAPSFQNKP